MSDQARIISDDFKLAIIDIEAIISKYCANEVTAMRKVGGDKMADELLFSVAALFAGRCASYLHVTNGEPINSVKARFIEAFNFNVDSSVRKYITALAGGKMDGTT